MTAAKRRPLPPQPARAIAYRIETPEIDFESGPLGSAIFRTLDRVRAHPVAAGADLAPQTVAEARGYRPDELWALAEIGYHYLFAGGYRIAHAVFAGLAAIAPGEAYFALALGLAADRNGDEEEASRAYRSAAELDRSDPRPELNLAELALGRDDHAEARRLLLRAEKKAAALDDLPLVNKARALLARSQSPRRKS